MAYRETAAVAARKEDVRRRILFAARASVAEAGFGGTSIAGIARRAGLSTGSIYTYFPARKDLFAALFRGMSARELGCVEAIVGGPGSAPARLERAIRLWCERALKGGRMAHALLTEPVDPEVAAERRRFQDAYAALFADLIGEGVAAGALPPQDARVTATALIGAATAVMGRAHADGVVPASRQAVLLLNQSAALCLGAAGLQTRGTGAAAHKEDSAA